MSDTTKDREMMGVDEVPTGFYCGGDEIPAGTFHGGDEIPAGTFHGQGLTSTQDDRQ
jgi:hypothetical protein